jgi:hypothetical protein
MRSELLMGMLAALLVSGSALGQPKGGPPAKSGPMSSPTPLPSSVPAPATSVAPSTGAATTATSGTASGPGAQGGGPAPRAESSSALPSAPSGPGAPLDPVTKELNVALRHASSLRREISEGRSEGKAAEQLIEQIAKSLLAAHAASTGKDRTGDDDAWSTPRAEAQRLLEDVARRRHDLAKLPASSKEQASRQLLESVGAMQRKIVEASRKRHEMAMNSVRNVR